MIPTLTSKDIEQLDLADAGALSVAPKRVAQTPRGPEPGATMPILTPSDIEQLDVLIEKVRNEPLFVRMLIERAAKGEDEVESFEYQYLVSDAASCETLYAHGEAVRLGEVVKDPQNRRRREFMKNASVDDLLRVRARLIADMPDAPAMPVPSRRTRTGGDRVGR